MTFDRTSGLGSGHTIPHRTFHNIRYLHGDRFILCNSEPVKIFHKIRTSQPGDGKPVCSSDLSFEGDFDALIKLSIVPSQNVDRWILRLLNRELFGREPAISWPFIKIFKGIPHEAEFFF